MIHRKFNKLKFKRTYVGGSKQRELEIFHDVQGTKEDNSEVNWLEYRRVFTQYSDDILNIVLSWRQLTINLRTAFLILAVLASFMNPVVALIILSASVLFQLAHQYVKHVERKRLSAYDFSLDIILSEIKRETGFNFDKN